MMPAVRRPYSAGSAPVISSTLPASRGFSAWLNTLKPLGQDHAVQPVLQAVVLAADVQLAVAVLRHARRLQDHLVERRVLAAGRVSMAWDDERIGRGADLRLDGGARRVEPLGRDDDL